MMFDMRFHYNTSNYSGTACVVLGDDWVPPDIQNVSTDETRSNERIDTTMLQRLAELSMCTFILLLISTALGISAMAVK